MGRPRHWDRRTHPLHRRPRAHPPIRRAMKKVFLPLLWIFFALFLFYPIFYVLQGSFTGTGAAGGKTFTLHFFALIFSNELYRLSFANSLVIALTTVALTLALSLPLALLFARYRFPGRAFFNAALLVPLILPPFVGAIGLKHLFARFGSVNLLLTHIGIISLKHPIDWFGAGGLFGIILIQVLHLFPIMQLSLAAALENIDPSLSDAAANLGAGKAHIFRTVTLPLLIPGLFAGASIVFVNAFTDLGTPLIFDFRATVPAQIFNTSSEAATNPVGYALVVLTLALVSGLFLLGKKFGDSGSYAMM